MELLVTAEAIALGKEAARRVATALRENPALVLALPTGETPTGMYDELIRLHRDEGLSFADATTFNLDEYVGLDLGDAQSCAAFMHLHFFAHVDLHPNRRYLLDGRATNLDAECARYERAIAHADGIDLAVIGLGANGHVGFNEPGSPSDSRTAVQALAPRTLTDNARLYAPGTFLPTTGYSMGLGTIRDARAILLLAFGARKAPAIVATLHGPITIDCPASTLREHPRFTALIDRAAASELQTA